MEWSRTDNQVPMAPRQNMCMLDRRVDSRGMSPLHQPSRTRADFKRSFQSPKKCSAGMVVLGKRVFLANIRTRNSIKIDSETSDGITEFEKPVTGVHVA